MKLRRNTIVTQPKYTNGNCLSTLYGALFAYRKHIAPQPIRTPQSPVARGFAAAGLSCGNAGHLKLRPGTEKITMLQRSNHIVKRRARNTEFQQAEFELCKLTESLRQARLRAAANASSPASRSSLTRWACGRTEIMFRYSGIPSTAASTSFPNTAVDASDTKGRWA